MTMKEAVEFCENTECEDCPVMKMEDCRVGLEKEYLLCCMNLFDPELQEKYRNM